MIITHCVSHKKIEYGKQIASIKIAQLCTVTAWLMKLLFERRKSEKRNQEKKPWNGLGRVDVPYNGWINTICTWRDLKWEKGVDPEIEEKAAAEAAGICVRRRRRRRIRRRRRERAALDEWWKYQNEGGILIRIVRRCGPSFSPSVARWLSSRAAVIFFTSRCIQHPQTGLLDVIKRK